MELFTIPSAETVITSSSAYSAPFFTEFLPIVYVVIGLVVAGLAIRWLTRTGNKGVRGLLSSSHRDSRAISYTDWRAREKSKGYRRYD